MDFIPHGTKYDFVGKRWIFGIVSGVLVLASLLSFFLIGPNWGIDFTGGTEIQIRFQDAIDIGDLRKAVGQLELESDAVQQIGRPDEHTFTVRIKDPEFGTAGAKEDVLAALTSKFGAGWIAEATLDAQEGTQITVRYTGDAVPIATIQDAVQGLNGAHVQSALDDNTVYVKLPGMSSQIKDTISATLEGREFEVLQVDSVGPAAGAELRTQGLISTIATLAHVCLYVAFRFDLSLATGAVISVIHDTAITAGFFVLSRDDFNLPSVGALLTIVGYSINDKIVVYDRIRENMKKYRRKDLKNLINDSVNEILSRSIYTSVTVFVSMLLFVFLGGPVIQSFAKAMLLGVVIAAYSTVYVASPVVLIMQDIKPYIERYLGGSALASVTGVETKTSEQLPSDPGEPPEGGDKPLTKSEERRQARARGTSDT